MRGTSKGPWREREGQREKTVAAGREAIAGDANKIVQESVDHAIREGGEVGLQVAAYLHGQLAVDVWGGLADETTGRRVDGDTLFPVFSIAKAVTAVALHIQAEHGLVDYDTPIVHYWPEFGAHGKEKATVRDALTHRLGIPQMPEGVTPELMCDYDWMIRQLADMNPIFEPGTRSTYLAYTFGWPLAEVVRRTDPQGRPFGKFVQEEICAPLGIDSLWLGIPDVVEPRVARLINAAPPNQDGPAGLPGSLQKVAIPPHVGTNQEVFGRPDVRRACIPGASSIMNARSEARFFAMLANGGELNGVRLLSEERVRSLSLPRATPDEVDATTLQVMAFLGFGGVKIDDQCPPAWRPVLGPNPRTLWHDGAGMSIGWADPDAGLAVAICHNRMFYVDTPEENPFVPIAYAIRHALSLAGV